MKKIISVILIILLMGVMFAGCSSESKDSNQGNDMESNENSQNTGTNSNDSSAEIPSEVKEAEEKSGTETNVSMGQVGNNLSLPDGYPKDIIPLLDDANIVNVNDARDTISKAIGIGYMTNKSFEDAIVFYQEVMKDGTIDMENKTDDSFVILGSKGDYVVTIGGSLTNGTVTIILDVAPKNR